MAQFETTGGGVIDSGDKRIERKVIVATGGADPVAPQGNGRLTNISITSEPGGVKRAVYEYTRGGEGGATYTIYGKRIEVMGSSREVPLLNHPYFQNLTKDQVFAVQQAVENKENVVFQEAQQKLFDYLVRGIEYILVPSVVARVSEIESNIPNLKGVCKVANPSEVDAPSNTFWVLTSVSATSVGDRYEVTREYTSIPATWEDANFLYNFWGN